MKLPHSSGIVARQDRIILPIVVACFVFVVREVVVIVVVVTRVHDDTHQGGVRDGHSQGGTIPLLHPRPMRQLRTAASRTAFQKRQRRRRRRSCYYIAPTLAQHEISERILAP
jgi:hypothetical protein